MHLTMEKGWALEKIFKSAQENKHHYHRGTLALRNAGKVTLDGVNTTVSIFAPDGRRITDSKPIRIGRLAAGKTAMVRFIASEG